MNKNSMKESIKIVGVNSAKWEKMELCSSHFLLHFQFSLNAEKVTALIVRIFVENEIASPRLINGCSYSHVDAQNKHLLKHEKYKLTITS
ncbi:hypothetical protein T08_7050 [Trichinella sp. T8]|nr:hypothetical protein T08_7050 [Trichinella sp. T8]